MAAVGGRRDVFLIFPEEIWEIILNNVTDPLDLLNVCSTYPFWRNIVAKKLTKWMFPGILPFLLKYLAKQDILNCRLACKRWSEAISNFLEMDQPALHQPPSNILSEYCSAPRSLGIILYRTVSKRLSMPETSLNFHQALDCFKETFGENILKNPFLSRLIRLHVEKFEPSILDFLELYGSYIWYFDFSMHTLSSRVNLSSLDTAQFLWKMLSLVPNLRKLAISNCSHFFPIFHQNTEPTEQEILELSHFLEENPNPPVLNHLVSLDLHINFVRLKEKLEIAYSSQSKMYAHRGNFPIFSLQNFKNLKHLTFNIGFFETKAKLEMLKSFKECSELEQIYMNVEGIMNKHLISTNEELFESLEAFKTSLKSLTILYRVCRHDFTVNLKMDFPNLKELCIKIHNIPDATTSFNLNFLKCLQNLSKLKLIFHYWLYNEIVQAKRHFLLDLEISNNKDEKMVLKEKGEELVDLQYYLPTFSIYDGFTVLRKFIKVIFGG